ncbi:MAG: AEC family transporter, partial [Clostridia bacterium]|nr:AEC family transporter [Clostridia bacterium]
VGMLAAKLHFPAPVQTVVSGIGAMITPLSLIIIGVMLSESALMTVLRQGRSYLIAALRNLVIPLAGMLILRLLPLDADARLCVLVYLACPCATLTSIYAIRYDKAPEFCAHTVILSTLLFAATLPIIISVGQAML